MRLGSGQRPRSGNDIRLGNPCNRRPCGGLSGSYNSITSQTRSDIVRRSWAWKRVRRLGSIVGVGQSLGLTRVKEGLIVRNLGFTVILVVRITGSTIVNVLEVVLVALASHVAIVASTKVALIDTVLGQILAQLRCLRDNRPS